MRLAEAKTATETVEAEQTHLKAEREARDAEAARLAKEWHPFGEERTAFKCEQAARQQQEPVALVAGGAPEAKVTATA
jgi:hypothetical protein